MSLFEQLAHNCDNENIQNPEPSDNSEYKMKKAGPRIDIIVETKLETMTMTL